MIVAPEELMFYPDNLESPEFGPKEVEVTNGMGYLVYVTQAYIGGEGGAYFQIDPIEQYIPLLDGESTSLWVTYLGSARQQTAQLVIRTTSPTDHTLSVELTGKYFLD